MTVDGCGSDSLYKMLKFWVQQLFLIESSEIISIAAINNELYSIKDIQKDENIVEKTRIYN